jgi:Ca-activated chloride channel family protein
VVDWTSTGGPGAEVGQLAVLSPGSPNRDPYFLLTLPPPAALLRSRAVLTQPVDVVFCMDVSASTRGRKLNVLQEALHDGLVDLLPGDRFAVVAFDDDVRLFRRKLVAASPGGVDQAIRFVNRMRATGGTDPERALRTAAEVLERSESAASRHRIVVLLTDEADISGLGSIAARLRRPDTRLVVLGGQEDGRLVHHRLRGAKLTGGPAVALSRAAITFGPALGGVRFESAELNASYIYPAPERLPDLPLSTPVVLVGRLSQAPPAQGKVYLSGTFEGKPQTVAIPYRWRPLDPASPLPALWANRRIRRLQQLSNREGDPRDELQTAMESVRKEHGLQVVPAP